MYIKSISEFSLGSDSSLHAAMLAIQASGPAGCCLIHNEGVFVDIITDGDLRRALLDGRSLASAVSEVLLVKKRSPITVTEGESELSILQTMKKNQLRQLPILDCQGKVVAVAVLSELIGSLKETTAAVIMAGGRGSRLGRLTATTPKPMLPIAGRPILEHIVQRMIDQGVEDFYISVNYLAHKIEEYFGDGSKWGVRISYLRESEPLGTAGALALLPKNVDKDFIVVNGDVLTTVDYIALRCSHDRSKSALTICSTPYQIEIPFGVLRLSDKHVKGIAEKPVFQYQVSAGIYYFSNRIIKNLNEVVQIGMPEVVDKLLASGEPVSCFPIIEGWADVGTPTEYEKAIS